MNTEKAKQVSDPLIFFLRRIKRQANSIFQFYWSIIRHPRVFGATQIATLRRRSVSRPLVHISAIFSVLLSLSAYRGYHDTSNILEGQLGWWLQLTLMTLSASVFLWLFIRWHGVRYSQCLILYLNGYTLVYASILIFTIIYALTDIDPREAVDLLSKVVAFFVFLVLSPLILRGAMDQILEPNRRKQGFTPGSEFTLILIANFLSSVLVIILFIVVISRFVH